MSYKIRHTSIKFYLIIILMVSGCTGLLSPDRVEEPAPEDTILSMKIKAKLIESKELNGAGIHVKASNGLIVLTGFVETDSQRQLASHIVRHVPNVKRLDNRIQVKGLQ